MSVFKIVVLLLVAAITVISPASGIFMEGPEGEVAQLIRAGVQQYDNGKFDAAIELFSKAITIDPENAEALYERAMSYHAAQDYARCLSDVDTGLKLDSLLEPRFFAIGGACLSDEGESNKALRMFRKGLKRYPDDVALNLNVAVTLAKKGEAADARSHLKTVLRHEPNHPTANLHLATLYRAGGYRVPAVYQYLRFLTVEPTSPRSRAAAGSLLQVLNLGLEKTGEKEYSLTMFTDEPTDEGDFGPLSFGLSLLAAVAITEKYEQLEPAPRIAKIIDSLVELAQARREPEIRATFVWEHAISFLIEMRESDVLIPFSYVAFSQLKLDGGEEWLSSHDEEVAKLMQWLENRSTTP